MGIRLHFGSYHDVDSSELAFKLAASIAFKEGFKKAKPVLLEPIMKVEVETPEENTGDVIGDLSRRRGMLRGQESEVTGVKIHAEVPLSGNVRLCNSAAFSDQRSCIIHHGIPEV